jgi:hypothetical protein
MLLLESQIGFQKGDDMKSFLKVTGMFIVLIAGFMALATGVSKAIGAFQDRHTALNGGPDTAENQAKRRNVLAEAANTLTQDPV